MNTKAFTQQSLFAILMLVLFIAIIVYGYNSLINIQKTLSDEELKQIKRQLFDSTSICKNPSQAGRFDTIEIDNSLITHVCYLKDKNVLSTPIQDTLDSYGIFQDSTIVLLNGPRDVDFSGFSDLSRVDEFVIYDIIPLENGVILTSPNNECVIQDQGVVEFQYQC